MERNIVLRILLQQDKGMSESEILKKAECQLEELIKVLELLMSERLIDYTVDSKFEYSYRITDLGRGQLKRSRSQMDFSSFLSSLNAG